jgi:phospholipase/carboxylesterase
MSYLPCVEIATSEPADSAVIWLHGLGADGNDFVPLVPQLALPRDMAMRFVFPHAPQLPVTINGGYVMPAWYDIIEMSFDRKVDVAQLEASAQAVHRLIERELERGIDSRRIIIAGFSQGGAVSYQAALTFPKPLGGMLVLSGYFATVDTVQPHPANRDLPVLIQHGSRDPVVPEALGERGYQRLHEMDYDAEYQCYPMEHTLCAPQVDAISQWLQARLGQKSQSSGNHS